VIDEREIVRRAVEGLAPPEPSFDRLRRRRDRKRRNQRIMGGAIGIAVFVAAVWIVKDVTSLDRTRRVVPAGSTTGAAETEPTVTPTESADAEWARFVGIPSKGAEPSSSEEGKLVGHVGEFFTGWLYVFADGRVISWSKAQPTGYREQRLTPEGVELVRSGEIRPADLFNPFGVPASVWEDRTMRPYVPSRYQVCLSSPGGLEESEYVGVLPAAAADLLRGMNRVFDVVPLGHRCYDMTLDGARTLDAILADAGWDHGAVVGSWEYGAWSPERSDVSIYGTGPALLLSSFVKILPDGTVPRHFPF
jgi:hypothetical protein